MSQQKSLNFVCRSESRISAGLLTKYACQSVGGNGGGSNTFAQGGGKEVSKIKDVLSYVEDYISHAE